MASLKDHQSSKITKLLLLGDSGTGKTGSLASLVAGGYKLRVIDFDNGLDSLVHQLKKRCPDKLGNVEYVTLRDTWHPPRPGQFWPKATALIDAAKLLDNWPGLGKPSEWGADTILVIDSMTHFGNAAFNWATMFKSSKDNRAVYGEAQRAAEHIIAQLSGKEFGTNVIIICHIRYVDRDDGVRKGYPQGIGEALSSRISTYFNTAVQLETVGIGSKATKVLQTVSNGQVDLKTPTAIAKGYAIENGMAELFADLRGETTKPN